MQFVSTPLNCIKITKELSLHTELALFFYLKLNKNSLLPLTLLINYDIVISVLCNQPGQEKSPGNTKESKDEARQDL